MDTSSLVKIHRQKRNRLFFNQYEFCISGRLVEAFVLRYRDHAVMDAVLLRRRHWGRRAISQPGSWAWAKMEVSEQDMSNLHAVLDKILALGDRAKVTVCGDWIYIYTRTFSQAQDFLAWPGVQQSRVTQAVLRGDPDAINLKQSDYTHRTYLRWLSLSLPQKQNMRSLLHNQTDIRLSPGLDRWLNDNKSLCVWNHYFIDHNDSGVLTMLSLALGRIVRKTLPIKTY